MKYNIILLTMLAMLNIVATAQEVESDSLFVIEQEQILRDSINFSENHFRFVYIDHEPTTPVAVIHQRLEKLHDDAIDSGSCLVVYLADEDQPLVSLTNLPDYDPLGQHGKEEAYSELIKQMYVQTAHEIRASADLNFLKRLFGAGGIFSLFSEQDTQSKLAFKSVTLDFYVGQHFWNLRCNEDLLAQLFVSMKLDERVNTIEFPPTKLSFNVLIPRGEQLRYPKGMPFGRKNLGGINEKIIIKEY